MDISAVHSKYQNTYDSITSEEDRRNFIAEIGVEREQYRQDAINAKVAYDGLKMGIQVARDKRKQEDSYKDDKRIFSKQFQHKNIELLESGTITMTEYGYLSGLACYLSKDSSIARTYEGEILTKTEMAKRWHISKTSVSKIMRSLIEKELVVEIADGRKIGYEISREYFCNGV